MQIKRNPILILHIVVVDREKKDEKGNLRTQIESGCEVPNNLYALGIGIPAIGSEMIANYMVNMVELKNYYDADEDEDE